MLDPFVPAVPDGAVLADVRWYPDGRSPEEAYALGHLPGALRVGLEVVSAVPSDAAGRHPLPSPEAFAQALGALGIAEDDVVVAYDDAGGIIAARLVWMLRAIGCQAGLLDGGLLAWTGELETGAPAAARPPAARAPRPWPDDVLAAIDELEEPVLLDARPAERYAGAPDALDPRAGHIPGAVSVPARGNVGDDGRLLQADVLRERLRLLEPGWVSSCGSGVTACHTLLVAEQLGLPPGRLFPGSWSAWSRDRARRVAMGPDPG